MSGIPSWGRTQPLSLCQWNPLTSYHPSSFTCLLTVGLPERELLYSTTQAFVAGPVFISQAVIQNATDRVNSKSSLLKGSEGIVKVLACWSLFRASRLCLLFVCRASSPRACGSQTCGSQTCGSLSFGRAPTPNKANHTSDCTSKYIVRTLIFLNWF